MSNKLTVRKRNAKLINGAFKNLQYELFVTVDPNQTQTIESFEEYLRETLGDKFMDRVLFGSGTCLITGLCDYHFQGTQKDVDTLTKAMSKQNKFALHHYGIQTVEPEPD